MIDLESLLQGDEGRHFNILKLSEVREFIIQSLEKHGTEEKLIEANKVMDVMVGMLKKKKQITEHGSQTFIEIMMAAAFVHNLFYTGSVSQLFMAREKLQPIAEKIGLPQNGIDGIFQAVEAQLGDDSPVPQCKPIPGTPTELFAWAVWFTKEYSA